MSVDLQQSDCFDGLAKLPAKSVHCIVTSIPYLGLRDYGIPPRLWSDGSLCVYGLEPTVALYVAHTVELFDALRRVLRDDGVAWLNVGDSYSQYNGNRGESASLSAVRGDDRPALPNGSGLTDPRTAAGNKLLIPHRLAIALQDAGWIIRQDNVWAKKSPMPESIAGWQWKRCRIKTQGRWGPDNPHPSKRDESGRSTMGPHSGNERIHAKWSPCPGCQKCSDTNGWVLRKGSHRTTNAHEYIFQLVKSGSYFGDGEAAAEKAHETHSGGAKSTNGVQGVEKQNASFQAATGDHVETRNPRSVWHLSSESFKGAHFATFPTELVRRCLVSSCSKGGCCPKCGSQYAPQVVKERVPTRPGTDSKVRVPSGWNTAEGGHGTIEGYYDNGQPVAADKLKAITNKVHHDPEIVGNRDPYRHIQRTNILGYLPTCTCNAGPAVPPTVLDPFAGSGTTLQVAHWMGFNAIGFELNPAYIALAHERIATMPRCLLPKKSSKKRRVKVKEQMTLFP